MAIQLILAALRALLEVQAKEQTQAQDLVFNC